MKRTPKNDMWPGAKTACLIFAMILMVIAALATPIAIIYGVYVWVIADEIFKIALWEGVVMWIRMLACVIPGLVFYAVSR